jgi:membrane associated rhomboid family serine protease
MAMEPAAPAPSDPYFYDAQSRRPVAWVTWSLIASIVGVFVLQLLEWHRHRDDIVGDTLAFSPEALQQHRYYTLLTYAWAHAVDLGGKSNFFWLHIVTNMIPLACIGPALEEILGHLRYLGLYLGGAIFSVLVWYFFNADSDEPIIGASGAVFAVIAGIGVALPRQRVTLLLFYVLPLRMSLSAVALTACGVEAAFIVMQYIPKLAPYSLPEVAHTAHLGGAAFGALYAWLMLPRSRD